MAAASTGSWDVESNQSAMRDITNNNSQKKTGMIVGIAVLVLVVVGVAVGLGVYFGTKGSSSSGSDDNTVSGLSSTQYQAFLNSKMQPTVGRSDASATIVEGASRAAVSLPTVVDWSLHPEMVSPVKDQGQCGGCWAFSTIEGFEVAYNYQYKPSKSIVLSPLQVIACDKTDGGCNGGDPVQAYTSYLAPKSSGQVYLEQEFNYPWSNSAEGGSAGSCSYAASNGAVGLVSTNGGYQYAVTSCGNGGNGGNCAYTGSALTTAVNQLKTALQSRPVTVCIDASPWQNYKTGVFTNAQGCTSNYQDVDHCVQLVGYSGSETVQGSYWILKNQWTTSWGEKGYIRLDMTANTCCILCEATQVTVQINPALSSSVTLPPAASPTSSPPTTVTTPAPSGATTTTTKAPAGATTKAATTKAPAGQPTSSPLTSGGCCQQGTSGCSGSGFICKYNYCCDGSMSVSTMNGVLQSCTCSGDGGDDGGGGDDDTPVYCSSTTDGYCWNCDYVGYLPNCYIGLGSGSFIGLSAYSCGTQPLTTCTSVNAISRW